MTLRFVPLALVAMATGAVAADLADIKERGTLRVLTVLDEARPEFFSTAPGRAGGFDQEIVRGFARLHHLEVVVVAQEGWGGLVPALLAGRGDIIAGRFSDTAARREHIDFTVEVFPSRNVVLTRKPHARIDSVEALCRVRVGVNAGSSMLEALRAAGIPPANIDDSLPPGTYAQALADAKVEAVVWGVESAVAAQREDPAIELGAFLGPPNSLAWGVRKQDRELKRALDEYIENTRRSLAWNRLVVKYFGEAALEILRRARGEQ
jgi:ABC-type amino acid transport substrate-binding protein